METRSNRVGTGRLSWSSATTAWNRAEARTEHRGRLFVRTDANEQVAAMLRTIHELVASHLDPALQDRLLRCRQRIELPVRDFSTSGKDDRELALQAVRGIRTDEDSFTDDGAHNCYRALIRLELAGVLEPIQVESLRKAADWENEGSGFISCPRWPT